MCILSGCGGSGAAKAPQWRVVEVSPFRFEVPKGWTPEPGKAQYVAKHGSDFVQVNWFPLVHAYTDALFGKVEPELAARMAQVAQEAGGTVSGHRTVTVAGHRAHAYDVQVDGHTDRYTFVLRGMREFLLVCRADATVCGHLESSFQSTRA